MGDADVVGIDLDELHPQGPEAAFQLGNHLFRVVGADEGGAHEAFGPLADVLGDPVVAPVRISVEDAVEAGDVDAGVVHATQEEFGCVQHSEAAPVSQVCVKIDDGDILHFFDLYPIPRRRSRLPEQMARTVDSGSPM